MPLVNSYFDPARGGHALGDLRDAFSEALEMVRVWEDGGPEPRVEVGDHYLPITKLCGLLWNCTDIMPAGMCGEFEYFTDELPRGSTYAQGARHLKQLVAE